VCAVYSLSRDWVSASSLFARSQSSTGLSSQSWRALDLRGFAQGRILIDLLRGGRVLS